MSKKRSDEKDWALETQQSGKNSSSGAVPENSIGGGKKTS